MSPAARLAGLGTTIFTEMTAPAARTPAINLGQGFPDTDGPPAVIEAAGSSCSSPITTRTRRASRSPARPDGR